MSKSVRILNDLLDRYERSRHFREGMSAQRVILDASRCEWIVKCIENADEKGEFLDSLEGLKTEGLVDFSWVRFETGNLVDRIWLITEPDALMEAYRRAGRVPKASMLNALLNQLEAVITSLSEERKQDKQKSDASEKLHESGYQSFEKNYGILDFLIETQENIREKKKIPRFFFQSDGRKEDQEAAEKKNGYLLRFLQETAEPADEQMERVISTRLFGDSKYFERELRSKVISILKYIAARNNLEADNDEQLLAEYGVVKWPEIMEFCGNLAVVLDDGTRIDFSGCRYGAYINSDTVRHISRIEPAAAFDAAEAKILTIENKANYVWYLSKEKKEGELVLYHGGFLSPLRRKWFELIYDGIRVKNIHARYYHWSDIDLGGFRIFHMLKTRVFPDTNPYLMDRATLMEYAEKCRPLGDDSYRKMLEKLLQEDEYQMFHDVIRYMLNKNVRLEQEVLIG